MLPWIIIGFETFFFLLALLAIVRSAESEEDYKQQISELEFDNDKLYVKLNRFRSTLRDIRDQNNNDPNYGIWARKRASDILYWYDDEQ